MEYKLRKTPDQVVEMAVAAVRHAAKYTNNVEIFRRRRLALQS